MISFPLSWTPKETHCSTGNNLIFSNSSKGTVQQQRSGGGGQVVSQVGSDRHVDCKVSGQDKQVKEMFLLQKEPGSRTTFSRAGKMLRPKNKACPQSQNLGKGGPDSAVAPGLLQGSCPPWPQGAIQARGYWATAGHCLLCS